MLAVLVAIQLAQRGGFAIDLRLAPLVIWPVAASFRSVSADCRPLFSAYSLLRTSRACLASAGDMAPTFSMIHSQELEIQFDTAFHADLTPSVKMVHAAERPVQSPFRPFCKRPQAEVPILAMPKTARSGVHEDLLEADPHLGQGVDAALEFHLQ